MERHFEGFDGVPDIISQFAIPADHPLIPKDEEILYADYSSEGYVGDARVLFQRDGVLYEATGGHCSCYGLEDQWDPTPVTWEQLGMRDLNGYGYNDAFKQLVHSHAPRA